MKIKSQRDFVSGLMFAAAGVVFTVSAATRPVSVLAGPGVAYLPLLLSVLLTIVGAIVLFKSLTIETAGGDPIGAIAWRPLLAVVASIAVFGATIDRLGLVLAVALLVAIASLGGALRKGLGVLAGVLVLTLLAWLVLRVGLKLEIPVWPVAAPAAAAG